MAPVAPSLPDYSLRRVDREDDAVKREREREERRADRGASDPPTMWLLHSSLTPSTRRSALRVMRFDCCHY